MEPEGWTMIRGVTLRLAILHRAFRIFRAHPWGWILALWAALPGAAAPARPEPRVDFNRQIRPILSDHCFACHGPDEGKRKAGLRLDREEDAFRKLKSGQHALVAGKPESSTLVERILTKDPDEIMPPPQHEIGRAHV